MPVTFHGSRVRESELTASRSLGHSPPYMAKAKKRRLGGKPRTNSGPRTGAQGQTAATDTRLSLLRAAERLMAEKGIDSVSLREVSVAAGQLNNSAVAYHFGSRDALIDAILERHSAPIHERWAAQLDFIERQGGVTLRPLVEMLVVDIVDKLDDPDGGWEYLSICGQLLVTPRKPLTEREAARTPTVQRLITAMLPFYAVPQELLPLRLERLTGSLYTSVIAWQRREAQGDLSNERAVFVSELVDAFVALITHPPSPETLALLAKKGTCATEEVSARRAPLQR